MDVKITYNEEEYNLNYNRQSGYYEIELNTNESGVNSLDIEATDLFQNQELRNFEFQVFKEFYDQSTNKEKGIVYIYDYNTLEIKDVKKITDYTVELDDETNAESVIEFPTRFNAKEKDFVFLKKEGENFLGIFKDSTETKDEEDYQARIEDVSNIFDSKIFLQNENLINDYGVEDFIKKNIEDFFSSTYDDFTNLDYIEVEIKTHTKLRKTVEVDEQGLYNFHTFITNCKQNYQVFMDYKIDGGKLQITIEKKELENKYIDCTVADVLNYKKVFGQQILSKVEVLCKDTSLIKVYCLDCNSEVKEYSEIDSEDRVIGNTTRISVESSDEAYQNAVDQFKGNDYNYLVQFSLKRNSLIMPADSFKTGTPVKIKTKENIIVNGYITAKIERQDDLIVDFKVGKIRRTLRQQLKKEAIT